VKFYIVDGSGFLFRAYHAYPEIVDPQWKNVNVVYGFFRILTKLLMEKPDYFVITWDLPVPTKRHEMDTTYKANRPESPEDFKCQIPLVHQAVEEISIPNIWVAGYEADDVIATLAQRLQHDCDVTIISSDKDLKQLLTKHIIVRDPMKDIIINVSSFEKEFGFAPKHMLDYLALVGDASDNIKWVPWIWKKGAQKLVEQYHTIENIYDHIDEITGATKQKLIDWKKKALHSKKMVELMDVDQLHSMTLDDYKLDIDLGRFRQVLVHEYGFASMEKVLDQLKRKLQMPMQNSLF